MNAAGSLPSFSSTQLIRAVEGLGFCCGTGGKGPPGRGGWNCYFLQISWNTSKVASWARKAGLGIQRSVPRSKSRRLALHFNLRSKSKSEGNAGRAEARPLVATTCESSHQFSRRPTCTGRREEEKEMSSRGFTSIAGLDFDRMIKPSEKGPRHLVNSALAYYQRPMVSRR